jgi:hypothetical protein
MQRYNTAHGAKHLVNYNGEKFLVTGLKYGLLLRQ